MVKARGHALADPDPMAAIKAFCRIKFNKPSMLQHMEASRETEIDALNGAVVREGRALGIATPDNEAVTDGEKDAAPADSRPLPNPALTTRRWSGMPSGPPVRCGAWPGRRVC